MFFIMSPFVAELLLFCLYASVCFFRGEGQITLPKNVSVSAVLVFGDSFVDQGNNNYVNTLGKGNYLPYGKDFQGGKPTGRFSNGRTLPDFLAKALGVKDYLPPSLDPLIKDDDLQTGVSFASGGSGFDPLTTTITTAIPMSVQLDMFKQYIGRLKRTIEEEGVNNIITNSVVVIVAGNNDLFLSFPLRRPQYDVTAYSNMLVKLVLDFIQEIHTLGVRRIVVFSAPSIGCLPEVRTISGGLLRNCGDEENNAAQLYNSILKQQLQIWASSFPQSKAVFVDYYNPFLSIIESPHNYGFDVADKGCCGLTGEIEVLYLCNKLTPTCPDDSKYFFWDGFHPTEKGYSIIVNHILQDLVKTLF
ncbi:hypothetical protein L1987_39693 [Smallanthus sonchifolius]|uniref:Uncharacterized protein n=1 Tax=Smallanthus sonchifolius TaxID=185202 RepID=A0ACB9HM60_9ASTR|nr:hypothetical protein L1987_39693 [Smallanthus sonchifolius]